MCVALAPPCHQGMELMAATNEMMPVRSTIEMESPSTPTNQSTLKGRIQTARLTIWTPVALPWTRRPGACGSNQCQARSDATSMRKLATSATQRAD